MSNIELERKLENIALNNDTVSMSIAVVKNQDIIWEYCWGVHNRETGEVTTPGVYYRMASVSKITSALTMMTLMDKGMAELDKDISHYLGYKVRNPYYPGIAITLRHLMTHTSTLIETGNYNRICAGELPPYMLSEILRVGTPGYSADNYLKAMPGSVYSYSSFGTGVMGTIIEKITGMRFADYAYQAVFKPLELTCHYDPDLLPADAVVATPYEVTPGDDASGRGEDWLANSLKNKEKLYRLPIGEAYRMAQGNLYARPSDIARIVMVFTGKGRSQGISILSESQVKEMTKIQFSDETTATGLNLLQFDNTIVLGRYIRGHFGRAFGAFNACFFDLSDGYGVVLCTNGTNSKKSAWGYNAACEMVLNAIFSAVYEFR